MSAMLPNWAVELTNLYQSGAASQFIVYGNIRDRILLPAGRLGSLQEFLLETLLPRFDVVLSYDVGNGIHVERGGALFANWPYFQEHSTFPRQPREAVETLSHYFRYCGNLQRLQQTRHQVACIVKEANLLAPPLQGGFDVELSALSVLLRDWAVESAFTTHPLATFLLVENLSDLNPLLVNNPRAAKIKVELPPPEEQADAFRTLAASYPLAFGSYAADPGSLAKQLAGATLGSVETLLKSREYEQAPLEPQDLVRLKKRIVENDSAGLIEFVESARTLDDIHGMEAAKRCLRQDISLWRNNDVAALPKGYLLCGPVGTGKSFLVECLAGEAGVPVVKLKNFRDKWVGSTEGNLERIFRLLHALGRCYVFVDEADQTLGRREASGNDSGLSGRVYSMIAEEMGSSAGRGRILWILASSRPDLIEVDLKRPGRVDVKIPLLPAATPEDSYQLIAALAAARALDLRAGDFDFVRDNMPGLVTAGAAESLVSKMYREVKTSGCTPITALVRIIKDYRPPVQPAVLEQQIRLAVNEASDFGFVPEEFLQWLA